MKVDRSESIGYRRELSPSELAARGDARFSRTDGDLEMRLRPRSGNDVSQIIFLLSIMADDGGISERHPMRVIEALQNYGHLLCDREVEMLRDWLVRLSKSRKQ